MLPGILSAMTAALPVLSLGALPLAVVAVALGAIALRRATTRPRKVAAQIGVITDSLAVVIIVAIAIFLLPRGNR